MTLEDFDLRVFYGTMMLNECNLVMQEYSVAECVLDGVDVAYTVTKKQYL